MALDGAFLHKLKQEIEEFSLGARVEKVYQPAREEIVLLLRGKNFGGKLFLSARANSARVHFTASSFENPLSPPMFCMLLRKKLASARLTGVTQPGLERVLLLEFEFVNELGDVVSMRLAVEIMGRYSNIILVDENGVPCWHTTNDTELNGFICEVNLSSYTVGDVNKDGDITTADSREIMRYAVGLSQNIDVQIFGDADGNSKIDVSDARLVLRAAVGLVDWKDWDKIVIDESEGIF